MTYNNGTKSPFRFRLVINGNPLSQEFVEWADSLESALESTYAYFRAEGFSEITHTIADDIITLSLRSL